MPSLEPYENSIDDLESKLSAGEEQMRENQREEQQEREARIKARLRREEEEGEVERQARQENLLWSLK